MKTLPIMLVSFLIGFAAAYYYVAIQNNYSIGYTSGAVEAMTKVCPSLTEKFQAPKK